jgi:hypothetical protein
LTVSGQDSQVIPLLDFLNPSICSRVVLRFETSGGLERLQPNIKNDVESKVKHNNKLELINKL